MLAHVGAQRGHFAPEERGEGEIGQRGGVLHDFEELVHVPQGYALVSEQTASGGVPHFPLMSRNCFILTPPHPSFPFFKIHEQFCFFVLIGEECEDFVYVQPAKHFFDMDLLSALVLEKLE